MVARTASMEIVMEVGSIAIDNDNTDNLNIAVTASEIAPATANAATLARNPNINIINNNNREATLLTAHATAKLGNLTAINFATADLVTAAGGEVNDEHARWSGTATAAGGEASDEGTHVTTADAATAAGGEANSEGARGSDATTAAGGEANDEGARGFYINNINTSTSSQDLNATAAPATGKETTGKYPRNHLDVHVKKAIAAFKASTSWASFVTSVRGRGNLTWSKGVAPSSCTLTEQIPKIRHSRNDENGTQVCRKDK